MLFHLLGEEGLDEILTGLGYEWNAAMARRTVDYYLARTCHGSTLSAVVHAGVLARLRPGASPFFLVEALNNDVRDLQGGTTSEGIHLGAMAGVACLFEAQATAGRGDPAAGVENSVTAANSARAAESA